MPAPYAIDSIDVAVANALIVEANAEIAALQASVATKDETIATRDASIVTLNATIASKNALITTLSSNDASDATTIAKLQNRYNPNYDRPLVGDVIKVQ